MRRQKEGVFLGKNAGHGRRNSRYFALARRAGIFPRTRDQPTRALGEAMFTPFQHEKNTRNSSKWRSASLLVASCLLCPISQVSAQASEEAKAQLPYAVDDVFTLFSGRSKMLYEGEGSEKRFVMSINTEGFNRPKAPVRVRALLSDPSEAMFRGEDSCEHDAIELNFENWGEAQEFVVVAQDDDQADGNQELELRFELTQSDDPRFNGIELPPVALINVDDEVSSTFYEDSHLEIISDRRGLEEGDHRRIHLRLRLKQCPSWFGGWIMPVLDDESEARIVGGPRLERFSPFDWKREIELEIEMLNDKDADGDQVVKLMLPGMLTSWSGMSFGCGLGSSIHWHIPQPFEFEVHDNEKEGEAPPRATILKHGWDTPTMYSMTQGIEDIANSPFDGIFFYGNEASRVFRDTIIERSVLVDALEPMTRLDFGSTQQNYLAITIEAIDGGFVGQGMKNLIENFGNLGHAVAELDLDGRPIEGIAFDHEVYKEGENPWDWPEACPELTQEACQQAAFQAGEEMMRAVMQGWPTLSFMPLYGFWLHDPATFQQLRDYSPHPDAVQDIDMYGYFAAGLFAATVDTPAQYIDGGELYYLRTARQFERTYDWLTGPMVEQSPYLPEQYHAAYQEQAKQAFGVFDDRERHWGRAAEATVTVWEDLINTAKRHADVIWLYTQRHDWWPNDKNDWPSSEAAGSIRGTRGYVDRQWLEATKRAIEAE